MSGDIKKIIDAIKPLEINTPSKNEAEIYYENNSILRLINSKKDDKNSLKLFFVDKIELISPSPNKLKSNNGFMVDFSRLPLTPNGIKDFRLVILRSNSFYIIIRIEIENDYSIKVDKLNQNEIDIFFQDANGFKIIIEKYDELAEFYKTITKDLELLPIWLSGIGVINDFKKRSNNELRLSEIKSELKIDGLYFILKNWEDKGALFNLSKHKEEIEGLLYRLIINKIAYIFQYANSIPLELSDNFHLIRMRNGEISSESGSAYIDYFSKEGEAELIEIYKKIFSINASGVYLNPAYIYFSYEGIYEKSVSKCSEGLTQYSLKVQNGFKKINAIIDKVRDFVKNQEILFFSNVLSNSLSSSIYIDELPENIYAGLALLEEFYKQGYLYFGFYIKERSFNFKSKTFFKALILLLLVPVVFIDLEILIDKIIKDASSKNYLIRLFEDRSKLRVLSDNTLIDLKKSGISPISCHSEKNKIVGFFIGRYLYCALREKHLFNSILSLPEGRWYSLKDNIVIDGNSSFSYKGEKDYYHLFQKENTIIYYDYNKNQNLFLKGHSTKFFIFPSLENNNGSSFKSEVLERLYIDDKPIKIYHSFGLKKEKTKIVLNYNSKEKENIGRSFMFHLVIREEKIDKILSNNKKVIFKRKKSRDFIEFDILNKDNSINIEIFLR